MRRLSLRTAWFVLFLLCAASFALMTWAARTDSAIADEWAHIPAGYDYVHNLDYRFNPEHPPLVKALAMLPVLFINPSYPVGNHAWTDEVNGQWDMGTAFLYYSGNDANLILQTARIVPILLTILTIVMAYLLARRIMGPWWALLPAALFALDPTVIAHGHYVTTDVGAALGVLVSLYFFIQYMKDPGTRNLWYAGLAFGFAQVTKFSTPLLIPLYLFLMIVMAIKELSVRWNSAARKIKESLRLLGRAIGRFALICLIGYALVVYPVYFLFTFNYPVDRQVADTTALLGSFDGGPTPAGTACHALRCVADLDIRMAGNAVTRPFAEYLLGILMVVQRADGGNRIYFLGAVRETGGWAYFPVTYLLKEPLPTLAIVITGLVLAIWWMVKKRRGAHRGFAAYLSSNFAQFSMASFVVLYWGYSMHSPLNIGVRHLMPTIPLIFILAASAWKTWITRIDFSWVTKLMTAPADFSLETMMKSAQKTARSVFYSTAKYVVLAVLLMWLLVETLFAGPYFLSYFNEVGGGTWGGYRYVTDSNYDWGQDLLRLQAFVNAHPEIDKIAVDYFGGGNPQYYLGDRNVYWTAAGGNPADHGIHWFAVSINELQSGIQPLAPGETRSASDTFTWLAAARPLAPAGMGNVPQPDFRIGTSIFVYRL
ncbi:MAG TPA: glycosyltransferase family 39 protein [Candidatus Paceibacterota bacterium]|nr:glycosyltransferase family 39 protein [Candidatus Paceibacterota bacterium]